MLPITVWRRARLPASALLLASACSFEPATLTSGTSGDPTYVEGGPAADAAGGDDPAGGGDAAAGDVRPGDDICESDAALCARFYPSCGTQDRVDACGVQRTVSCGCPGDESCGGGINANICAAPLCNALGWCWKEPKPHGLRFYDLAGTAEDLWAVAEKGIASHWDGQRWTHHDLDSSAPLRTVWYFGKDDVWVGGTELVAHYDGLDWSIDRSTVTGVVDMAGLPPSDLWFVNGTNVLYHRNTATGDLDQLAPSAAIINAVHCTPPSTCWAVGAGGLLLFRDTGGWSEQTAPTNVDLTSVHVGPYATLVAADDGTVFRRSSPAWDPLGAASSSTPEALAAPDGAQVLASGCCGFSRVYDGTWRYEAVPWPGDSTITYFKAFAFIGSEVWGTGGTGTMARWSESAWHYTPMVRVTGGAFADAWVAPSGEAWLAAGGGGLARFDGDQTTLFRSPAAVSDALTAVWGSSSTNLWATHQRKLWHFNGSSWGAPVDAPDFLKDLWGTGGRFWAVGQGGMLLEYVESDGTWTPLTSGTSEHINTIRGRSATDIWMAGSGGAVVHLDNGAPTPHPLPVAVSISALWLASDGDVWVSAPSSFWRWRSGTGWSEFPGANSVTAFWGTAPNDIWACGFAGYLAHYGGTTWQRVETDLPINCRALWGDGTGRLCMAGTTFIVCGTP